MFLQKYADALKLTDLIGVIEEDAIGLDFEMAEAALFEFASNLGFVGAVDPLNVQDELIELKWIIVDFAQLDLPGAIVPFAKASRIQRRQSQILKNLSRDAFILVYGVVI